VTAQGSVADDSFVELSVPADTKHLRLARLAASGYGADLGFTLDDIEELRLAVGEACALLVDNAPGGSRLVLRYSADGPALVIEGRCPALNGAAVEVDPVAQAVMTNTVDTFEVGHAGAENTFRITKQAPPR
jgi:serine/threonine-protein kinase RsbW